MKPIVRAAPFLASVCAIGFAMPAMAQDKSKPPASYPKLPSEIPAKFKPVTDSFDHTRRKVMIPMRDDVKLHTVFLVPRGAKTAQDGAQKADIAPVTAFETGTNEWRRYSAWSPYSGVRGQGPMGYEEGSGRAGLSTTSATRRDAPTS